MANKITIKVKRIAYYNGSLVYPNDIIKGYVGKVPSWATLANGKDGKPDDDKTPEDNKGKEPNVDNVGQGDKENGEGQASDASSNVPSDTKEGEQQKLDTVGQNDKTAKEENVPAEKTEAELQDELNKLLDESVAKGIMVMVWLLLGNIDRKIMRIVMMGSMLNIVVVGIPVQSVFLCVGCLVLNLQKMLEIFLSVIGFERGASRVRRTFAKS